MKHGALLTTAVSRRNALWMFAFALVASWPPSSAAKEDPPAFVVIVNPKNRIDAAKRRFVADAFLKRTTRWEDDLQIRPVDLRPDSKTRAKFSAAVLKRSVAAVRSYWQQRIFSGRGVPPPELDSDDAVVSYVLQHRGAIGYVSGRASLRGARTIQVH